MINTIGVHIKVKDFKKSEKFYKSLGFKTVFEYGPNKKVREDYNGAVFEHKGAKLEIANGHRAVNPDVFREAIMSSKLSLMISVNSLGEVIKLCKRHKIKIAVGPRHYYWGTLEMVIKDPDGVVLVFIAPFTQSEASRLKSDETFAKSPIA
jgi:catechol 2,3-dioxygenase-like lactoylglutathione lyase family enzyme